MGARIVCALAATAVVASASPALVAQATNPAARPAEFEVASVKLHTSTDQRMMMVAQPGGRFVAANIPLRLLIRTAFQLQTDQIVGGPDWLASDRFDIEARGAGMPGAPTPELLTMLQSLLAERFKLTTHRERRELAVFVLERARRDGALGAKLRPTACPETAVDLSKPQPCSNISTGLASLSARGMPFDQLAAYLAPFVNRVIIDRTGLEGRYDFDLSWTPDLRAQTPGAVSDPPAVDPDGTSIFTALQEQLGLKLSATKAPVEVMVIDTLEHPTPN